MGSGFLGSPYSHPSDFVRDVRWIEAMNASFLCLKKGIAIYAPIVHWHNVHQRHVTQFESGYFWAQNRPMLEVSEPGRDRAARQSVERGGTGRFGARTRN